MPVVTTDSMITDNPSKKPLASNTKNIEESNDDSNPRVEYRHTYTEEAEYVPKKDVAEENARTYVPTYSIYPSDDKNNGSEPGVDTIVSTKVNAGDTLDDLSDYAKPMNTEKSDLKAYDKGTIDGPVAEIIMITDNNEKESEATNSGSQVKAIKYCM